MKYLGLFLLIGAAFVTVTESVTPGATESERIKICQNIKKYRSVLPTLDKFWKYLIQKYLCEAKKKGVSPQCGVRWKMPISLKIAGGVNAKENSWPWAVSLFMSEGLQDCVATLISENWVVTSATCIVAHRRSIKIPKGKPFEFTGDRYPSVRVGDHHVIIDDDNQEEIKVSKVILHPDYEENKYENLNDIALLRLKKKVSLNDRINIACLPNKQMNFAPGTKCTVLGWGLKSRGRNVTSLRQFNMKLQEVMIPLISHKQCKMRLIVSDISTSRHICAGEDGKGTRGGDSGAPLLCPRYVDGKQRWYFTGITSFEGGFKGKTYEVFTRVSSYSGWIERMLQMYSN